MGTKVFETQFKDQKAIAIENDLLSFKFLPRFGANLASAIDIKRCFEFMVQRPESNYRVQPFDGDYIEGECSGMDDMLPTITACYYENEPWSGIKLADHGEIWNQQAETIIENESIRFNFHGIRLPYVLQKDIRFISDHVLQINYTLHNNTQFDMDFLWAAHAMLNAFPGVRICVPDDLNKAICVFSNTGNIGSYGQEIDWPVYVDKYGVTRKINVLWEPDGCSEKYYFSKALKKGWCAAQYPDGLVFGMSFPADKVSYLGVLHNLGSFRGIYNLFLEPCTASFDRPDIASAKGQSSMVKARSRYQWYLNISINQAQSFFDIDEDGVIVSK